MIKLTQFLEREKMRELKKQGRVLEEFPVYGVIWVKKYPTPLNKWCKAVVYQFNTGFGGYIRLFEITVSRKKLEGPEYC